MSQFVSEALCATAFLARRPGPFHPIPPPFRSRPAFSCPPPRELPQSTPPPPRDPPLPCSIPTPVGVAYCGSSFGDLDPGDCEAAGTGGARAESFIKIGTNSIYCVPKCVFLSRTVWRAQNNPRRDFKVDGCSEILLNTAAHACSIFQSTYKSTLTYPL